MRDLSIDQVAVVATVNEVEFVRFFAARLDMQVWVFDEGHAALDAQRRMRARYMFCDATALRDGLTGYRLAMQLRAGRRAAAPPQLYLFADPQLFHEQHRAMLDRIGVQQVLPRSPEMVAQVLRGDARAKEPRAPGFVQPSARMAATQESLYRLVGPVASKLIARVHMDPTSLQVDIGDYVNRLAAEIRIPEMRESFLRAAHALP